MDTDKLRRLVIGDSIEATTGYRIDYLQPAERYAFAYSVSYQDKILMMTREAERLDRYLVCQFVERINLHTWIDLPPAGTHWRTIEAGSVKNPLWDSPIKVIRTPDADWFSEASPHTGKVRRYLSMARRNNHRPERIINGQLHSVDVTPVQCKVDTHGRSLLSVGCIYTFQENSYYLRDSAPLLRLAAIRETTVGNLTSDYLAGEGLVSWQQYRARWKRGGNRKYAKTMPIWVLDFVRVHRIAPVARPALMEQPQMPIIQQLPLLAEMTA